MISPTSTNRLRMIRVLVVAQTLLLLASLFAPIPIAAADPGDADSSPAATEPAPDPTATPAPDPTPAADPTAAPDPTPALGPHGDAGPDADTRRHGRARCRPHSADGPDGRPRAVG